MIPRYIHQVWMQGPLKESKHTSISLWKRLHPTYTYMFWTEVDIRRLITTHYHEYIDFYNSLRYMIQRADVGRIFILHHYGGVYADCDYFPLKSFETLFQYLESRYDDIVGVSYCNQMIGSLFHINNALMISSVHNSFWLDTILPEIMNRVKFIPLWLQLIEPWSSIHLTNYIQYTTGPYVYSSFKHSDKYHIFPRDVIYSSSGHGFGNHKSKQTWIKNFSTEFYIDLAGMSCIIALFLLLLVSSAC